MLLATLVFPILVCSCLLGCLHLVVQVYVKVASLRCDCRISDKFSLPVRQSANIINDHPRWQIAVDNEPGEVLNLIDFLCHHIILLLLLSTTNIESLGCCLGAANYYRPYIELICLASLSSLLLSSLHKLLDNLNMVPFIVLSLLMISRYICGRLACETLPNLSLLLVGLLVKLPLVPILILSNDLDGCHLLH